VKHAANALHILVPLNLSLNACRNPSALHQSLLDTLLTTWRVCPALEHVTMIPCRPHAAQMLDFVTDKDGSQRSLSLFVLVGVLFLEVGRDGLHDLLGLGLVVNGVSVKVPGRAELQLGDTSLFILLDCDLIGLGEVVLFPPHHLDEFFQIFDFLGLRERIKSG